MSIFKDLNTIQYAAIFVIIFLVGTAFVSFFISTLSEVQPEATAEEASNLDNLNWLFGFASILCVGGCVLILLKRKRTPYKEEQEEVKYVLKKIR